MRILSQNFTGPILLSFGMAATLMGAEVTKPKSPPHTSVAPPVWVTRAMAAPRVTHDVFASASVKGDVSYHLYRPASYETDTNRRFPVVYWLHGSGAGLPGIPSIAKRFDEAITSGKIPPCMVVFVNGLEMGMYVDWADGSAPVESMIIRDLLPHIDTTYRTRAESQGRLLDGFSMGGYGAARLGFKYPSFSARSPSSARDHCSPNSTAPHVRAASGRRTSFAELSAETKLSSARPVRASSPSATQKRSRRARWSAW